MTPPTFSALLVTCEHASNAVPGRWRKSFVADSAVLKTHRGWDPGAVVLARELAGEFDAPLHEGEFTRLLIDLIAAGPQIPRFGDQLATRQHPLNRSLEV